MNTMPPELGAFCRVKLSFRGAYELGFNVTIGVDSMTDLSAEAYVNSITRIFPRLGQTGTTQEIIDVLKRRDRQWNGFTTCLTSSAALFL
jgi:hypothetical protein